MKRRFRSKRVASFVPSNYRKWKMWEKGDEFIGEFIDLTYGEVYKGNTPKKWNFKYIDANFQVEDKKGNVIAMDETKRFTLNGVKALDDAMETIEAGEIVRVVFLGEQTYTNKKGEEDSAYGLTVEVLELEDESDSVEL
jgi:hypothetical protein